MASSLERPTLAPTPKRGLVEGTRLLRLMKMGVHSATFYGAADDASGWRILTRRRLL